MKIRGWRKINRGRYEFKENGHNIQGRVIRDNDKWLAVTHDPTDKFSYKTSHKRWTTANDSLIDMMRDISNKAEN